MGNGSQPLPGQVLYDDLDITAFMYGGPQQWSMLTLPQWYGGTTSWPGFSDPNPNNATGKLFGTLTCTFDGTAAAFVGNTPAPGRSQVATVSIDGGEPFNVTYPDPPRQYIQWYKTPTLPPGNHTVSITNIDGTALDYAIIDLAPNTDLTGRAMVVDDSSPDIEYSGSWTQSSGFFNAGGLPPSFPFGNGTHSTSSVGDKIAFSFSGSQVNVYGVFNWAQISMLGINYAIDDGVPSSQLYPVTPTSQGFTTPFDNQSNFLFFSANSISPGEHTLVITITQAENTSFVFDYITYTPNFGTLDQMPNIPLPTLPSTPTTTSAASQATSTTSGHTVPMVSSHSSGMTSVILGSVLGTVAAVALCSLALCFWRRRQTQDDKDVDEERRYPEMHDAWRPLQPPPVSPPSSQRPSRAEWTTRGTPTTADPYLNLGPNTQPMKQGFHSPNYSQSETDYHSSASASGDERPSYAPSPSAPSDVASSRGAGPSRTTDPKESLADSEERPTVILPPPAYAMNPPTPI